MSNFPENLDVFTNKTGEDFIASSDPNNAYDGVETTQGLIGALGKPQSWSTTLITLLREYQRGMLLSISGATINITAGEAVLENTDGTKWVFRRNVSDVPVTASNIDVGSLVVATYYVYAKGDGAATTAPIVFSTDANAPSGIGTAPYLRLGWFANQANGSLTPTGYNSDNLEVDKKAVIKAWINFNGTGTIAINDSFNASGITDNGTGDYTITWDTNFANINYSFVGSAKEPGDGSAGVVSIDWTGVLAVGSARITVRAVDNTPSDSAIVCGQAVGEQ